MFRPSTRRLAEAIPKLTGQKNPYKAQKEWPPDFSKLHPKHQFRLERRYRRRSKLKWARPRWTKAVKLTSWGSSACSFPSTNFRGKTCLPNVSCVSIRSTIHGLGRNGRQTGRTFRRRMCCNYWYPAKTLLIHFQIREWFHETVDSIWTASPKTRHNPTTVLPEDDQLQNTKG